MVTEEELEREARILIESAMHVEPTFEDETQIWRLFSQPLLAHPSAAKTFIRGHRIADDPMCGGRTLSASRG
jgi:hypothetical protein